MDKDVLTTVACLCCEERRVVSGVVSVPVVVGGEHSMWTQSIYALGPGEARTIEVLFIPPKDGFDIVHRASLCRYLNDLHTYLSSSFEYRAFVLSYLFCDPAQHLTTCSAPMLNARTSPSAPATVDNNGLSGGARPPGHGVRWLRPERAPVVAGRSPGRWNHSGGAGQRRGEVRVWSGACVFVVVACLLVLLPFGSLRADLIAPPL